MSYKGKNVEVDGTTVTIKASSAATAREIAAGAEQGLIEAEGTKGQKAAAKVDGSAKAVGAIVDTLGVRSLHVISFVALFLACMFMWKSGQNLTGIKGAGWLFSVFLVLVAIGAKIGAGRWGKAVRLKSYDRNWWAGLTVGLVLISALFGLAFQAGVTVSQETGKSAVVSEMRSVKSEIADLQLSLTRAQNDLSFPVQSAEALRLRFDGILARDPGNARGEPSGKPLGEWVEYGTDNFCRGTSYYKTTLPYCEQLLDLREQIAVRESFEADTARLADLRDREAALLNDRASMQVSSAGAIGQVFGGNMQGSWLSALIYLLPGMLFILVIDILMVGSAWLAYRFPNGVEGDE